MSNTYRFVDYSAIDSEHWDRFGIKSLKHLKRDRHIRYNPRKIFRWDKYFGHSAEYREEQRQNSEYKKEINDYQTKTN